MGQGASVGGQPWGGQSSQIVEDPPPQPRSLREPGVHPSGMASGCGEASGCHHAPPGRPEDLKIGLPNPNSPTSTVCVGGGGGCQRRSKTPLSWEVSEASMFLLEGAETERGHSKAKDARLGCIIQPRCMTPCRERRGIQR